MRMPTKKRTPVTSIRDSAPCILSLSAPSSPCSLKQKKKNQILYLHSCKNIKKYSVFVFRVYETYSVFAFRVYETYSVFVFRMYETYSVFAFRVYQHIQCLYSECIHTEKKNIHTKTTTTTSTTQSIHTETFHRHNKKTYQ